MKQDRVVWHRELLSAESIADLAGTRLVEISPPADVFAAAPPGDGAPRYAAAAALPVSPALRERTGALRARELALTGGDDYELCFTLAPAHAESLARLVSAWQCPVTRIGEVTAQPGLQWWQAGAAVPLPAAGYRHF